MPKRIQRKRTKGWRMPAGVVYVGRGSTWGNPWRVGDEAVVTWPFPYPVNGHQESRQVPITAVLAVELYRIAYTPSADEIRARLAGKDLACWCPLDQPCHADVLLEIANGGTRSVCPECEQGKHGNCDGTAWDDNADAETECGCRHG